MHFVLASVGSLGDVHPFVAIGAALRQRGHRVTLICNDAFASLVERSGIEFASAGAAVDLSAAAVNPNLWHPIKGLGVFWRAMLAPAIEPTFRQIEKIAAVERCVVVAVPTMFGARFARELLGVRLISAVTAPAILRSDAAPLTMAHWRLPHGTPQSVVRMAWRALDRYKLHPMATKTLQGQAERLGARAPPADISVFGDWMFSPDGALTLFPEWFARRRSGWPAILQFGGFPLFDDADESHSAARLPNHVERFLQAGEPPLVFMPGSAMRHASAFFAAATQACSTLRVRAILLSQDASQLPASLPASCPDRLPTELPTRLPADILHAPYLPFGTLLPRCLALVHHGGIGSCAQALRAGIPQLLMPMSHDQFDNAQCVLELGAGAALRPKQFDGPRLALAIQRLRNLPKPALRECSERLQTSALPQLCDSIEAMA